MVKKKLKAKQYYDSYCSTCQYTLCNGPKDRPNNDYFLKKCSYYDELMSLEEEMVEDLWENASAVAHFFTDKYVSNLAKKLIEKGWKK